MEAALEAMRASATVYKHPTEKWIAINADTHKEAKRIWRALDGQYVPDIYTGDELVMTWKNIKPRGQMKKPSTALPLSRHQEEEEEKEEEETQTAKKNLYDLEFPPLS